MKPHIHTRIPKSLVLTAAVSCLWLPQSASAQFGELPTGAERLGAISGVTGELAFTLFAPPEMIQGFIPEEYHLISAGEISAGDSLLAAFLEANPGYGDWVLTSFTVSAVDSLSETVGAIPRPDVLANWAAPVAVAAKLPNPIPAGAPVVYEIGTWIETTSDSVSISVWHDERGTWHLDMRGPSLWISGSCEPQGDLIPAAYEAPGYVVMVGGHGNEFTVLTFHGHEGQECAGNWISSGSHPLSQAFKTRPHVPGLWAQDMIITGWRARMAVYDRALIEANGG